MNSTFWAIIDLCAATAGFLVFGSRRILPVELFAHRADKFLK